MKNNSNTATHFMPSLGFRFGAAAFGFLMFTVGLFSLYWLWAHIVPIYGRIYRGAPIVETPYLAFCLLMAPPAVLVFVIAASVCAWTGKKFDPPNHSFLFRFQNLMFSTSIKTIIYVVPTMMIITTAILLLRNYSPCPKLLISGSAWQLFWVNDESACFKPTRYINDNWPCKIIADQEVCFRSDRR